MLPLPLYPPGMSLPVVLWLTVPRCAQCELAFPPVPQCAHLHAAGTALTATVKQVALVEHLFPLHYEPIRLGSQSLLTPPPADARTPRRRVLHSVMGGSSRDLL